MPVSSGTAQECSWVVEKCKACLSTNDRSAAKAWILTARSLFPDNFDVQYEAFMLHSSCNENREAALALSDLCSKFPQEPRLKKFVHSIMEVFSCTPDKEEGMSKEEQTEAQGKRDLFSLLPPHTRKTLLVQASESASDVLTKCRLWLTTIKMFPETAKTIGLDLYDVLSQQPVTTPNTVAANQYRELLVVEVIPMLAESPEVIIERPIIRSNNQTVILKTSHLCQWLESAACYYTTLTAESLLLGKEHTCAGRVGWEKLYRLFMKTAEKCNWKDILHSKHIGPHLPANLRWLGLEKISGYVHHMQSFEAPRPVAIACFYISVFLFFEMAWIYCRNMLYYSESGDVTEPVFRKKPWILIEDAFTKHSTEEKPKRRKVEEPAYNQPVLQFSTGLKQRDQDMMETFLVAIHCWDFLQSNVTYRGEFSRLCQQWGAFEWEWLNSFRADMALYKGDHNLAMQILKHEWHKVVEEDKNKPHSLRRIVQMVNCSVVMGDVKASCNYASEVVSIMPDSDPKEDKVEPATPIPLQGASVGSQGRSLKLLTCVSSDILSYCIEVIIRSLRDVVLANPKNNHALGQLLVLVQYQWPRQEEMLAKIITTIQKRRKFNFPEFFNYVITVDILEEMMFLCNSDALQINLMGQDNNAQARTVTRGVNRNVRVDLEGAMERQVKRCYEPIEPLLRKFFQQENLSVDLN